MVIAGDHYLGLATFTQRYDFKIIYEVRRKELSPCGIGHRPARMELPQQLTSVVEAGQIRFRGVTLWERDEQRLDSPVSVQISESAGPSWISAVKPLIRPEGKLMVPDFSAILAKNDESGAFDPIRRRCRHRPKESEGGESQSGSGN
jgi:hypothetical protein